MCGELETDMVTLKEIAKAAGVSTATVSNVINGKENHVSEETVSHIREIIQQLGYIPNEAARSLAQRKTRVVALIQQGAPGENILTNPYNAVYIGALTSCLSKKGYYPMIRVTDDYKSIDQRFIRRQPETSSVSENRAGGIRRLLSRISGCQRGGTG